MPTPRGRSELIEVHCVVCTKLVPDERLKFQSVTCSKECADTRENDLRLRRDQKECRYCRKPSTPKQRAAYARFAKMELRRPDLLYPEEFEKFKASSGAAAGEGGPTIEPTPKNFAAWRESQAEPAKEA